MVLDRVDIESLWEFGCFGKGLWGRGVPAWVRPRRDLKKKNDRGEGGGEVDASEGFVLSPEETMFLTYALDVLQVKIGEHYLGLDALWQRLFFQEAQDLRQCVARYTAYHYYRSRGWVVRDGIKFGTDFVLYRDGPEFQHAEYGVIVMEKSPAHLEIENTTLNSTTIHWRHILGQLRVCAQARKRLIYCEVTLPCDCSHITCLHNCSVAEVVLSRWRPERTR